MRPKGMPYEDQPLTRLARLYSRGAQKRGARNWEKSSTEEELDHFYKSANRHFEQWATNLQDGEDHFAGTLFNMIGVEFIKWKRRYDQL